MRKIEFIQEVKAMGLEVLSCPVYMDVVNNDRVACTISNISMHDMHIGQMGFWQLDYDQRAKLFDLCVKYANTPNQERN